ncbi:hypothetical protein DDZ14_18615 [Maritimibacter sp. 55A14]|uniref:hypothetical protein n=1 Tax=Maritimibacter sp. 55A14 TaxID=2174844 RepID=UPI000D619E9A|nr:hypothetical protein [Maritimibacter sp. 55A14]PWE28803.1 hypothetical protein DDZ14_18615 [Maritimibacter sp. 55A14]
MIRIRLFLLFLPLWALSACLEPIPKVDTGFSTAADPDLRPRLIPLDGALPEPGEGRLSAEDMERQADRADSLRRRAAALNATVIGQGDRKRLEGGVTRPADADAPRETPKPAAPGEG